MGKDAVQASVMKEGTIISIIRGVDASEAVPIVEALMEEGIHWSEVSLSDEQRGLECVAVLNAAFGDDLHLGVGTVIRPDQAERAVHQGAKYVITPGWDRELIRYVKEVGVQVLPGVCTPGEVMQAVQEGITAVKLFPAGPLGTSYVKQLRGPFPHIHIMAVGGVTAENLLSFYDAGCRSFGIGSDLVPRGATASDIPYIREQARKYMGLLRERGGIQNG